MKPRPNLLKRLIGRLLARPARTAPKPAPPTRPRAAREKERPPGIEPLEGRVAPATLLSASAISFTDLDGDLVTVTFSKPLFDLAKTPADNRLDSIFKFSNGLAGSLFDTNEPQQLQLIDITQVPVVTNGSAIVNPATNTDIIVESTPGVAGGDGLTNIGGIEANGVKLGKVKIDGDLGQIDAGTGNKNTALKVLKVGTLGQFGASTQVNTTPPADALESRIVGQLKKLKVQSDLYGYVNVVDGAFGNAPAAIGVVKVGGSLIGDAAAAATSDNTGSIRSAGTIGSVNVGGALTGGGGAHAGSIVAAAVTDISIAGSMNGGAGLNSGAIVLSGDLGTLSIGQGVAGSAGAGSASVQVTGKIGAVDVAGGIQGGAGEGSAVISSTRSIDSISVGGSIMGGGTNSAGISAKHLPGVTVGGSLLGATAVSGTVFHTGFIEALANGGTIKVKGALTGGDVANSGVITTGGTLAKVVVKGAMTGGAGANSGSIFTGADFERAGGLALAKLKGGVTGGEGLSSGSLIAGGPIASAIVGGNLTGGGGIFSGIVWSDEGIGSVVVSGSVAGGSGANSGAIHAGGVLASAAIAGGVIGGAGELSGAIVTHGEGSDATAVSIGAAITGGAGPGSGGLRIEGSLGALDMQGPLVGANIRSAHAIGAITAAGMSGATISAGGPAIAEAGLTIGSIKIGGNVSTSQILAGYDLNGFAVNADVAIGKVKATGNWTSSDLVAGVEDVNGDGFGNGDDAPISGDVNDADLISKIGKIVVKGSVSGTAATDDHFGFTAERIVEFKTGGSLLPLLNPAAGQIFELGLDNDTTVREVLSA